MANFAQIAKRLTNLPAFIASSVADATTSYPTYE